MAQAADRGLTVHAGHGLTYRNVAPIVAIREIEEVSIGHSIVSRSVFVGMEQAVREMLALVGRPTAARRQDGRTAGHSPRRAPRKRR